VVVVGDHAQVRRQALEIVVDGPVRPGFHIKGIADPAHCDPEGDFDLKAGGGGRSGAGYDLAGAVAHVVVPDAVFEAGDAGAEDPLVKKLIQVLAADLLRQRLKLTGDHVSMHVGGEPLIEEGKEVGVADL